jgi:hypothetical protein
LEARLATEPGRHQQMRLFDPWPVNGQEFQVFAVGQKKTIATVIVPHPAE